MKAVVIGGTSGIGYETNRALAERDYEVITLSRSQKGSQQHYVCDVGDSSSLEETLGTIAREHPCIDVLACVVGFSNPKDFKELDAEDWHDCFSKNLIYVAQAFQKLDLSLSCSNNPRGITFGSQWSYKTGCNLMSPYSIAKSALRSLTQALALLYPRIKVNNFCIPITDTPGFAVVRGKLAQYKYESSGGICMSPANPKDVAKTLIETALTTEFTGATFVVEKGFCSLLG